MIPTIIIESKLYQPHYDQILSKIIDSKEKFRAHEKIPYKDYENVLFPYARFNIETNSVEQSYAYLAHHTVFYQNENIFKQLRDMNFDFNRDDIRNDSILATALQLATTKNPSKEITNILKVLLECQTTDLSSIFSLGEQTALHYIAAVGDAHIDILNIILKRNEEFTRNIFGANALTISVQECQYKTTEILLDTAQGQTLTNQARNDGTYPLEIACEFMTNVEKGSTLIKKMLQHMDAQICPFSRFLIAATLSPNPNSDCKYAFCKILLEHGVYANDKGLYKEIIIQISTLYSAAKSQSNTKDQDNYKKIFTLFVKYNFVLFETHHELKRFLKSLLVSNAQDLSLIMYEHAKNNDDELLLELIDEMATELMQYSVTDNHDRKQPDEYYTLMKEITEIGKCQDEQMQKYYFDNIDKSALRQMISLYELVKMFHSGRLNEDGILKLIVILDKKPEYKKFIPYLYRQYLIKVISEFSFNTEIEKKEKIILNLFLCLVKLVQYLPFITEEDTDVFKPEINAIMQKAIQLALISADFYNNRSLGKFIFWIDKIDSSCFDEESMLMILQLNITDAYFSGNKKTFTEYHKKLSSILPAQHLLNRQYDYWQADLTFSNADKESIETLSGALNKLNRYNLNIKFTQAFRTQLNARLESEAKAKKADKKNKKLINPPSMTVDQKNDTPETTLTNIVTSAAPTTTIQPGNISNHNNNCEFTPKVKVKKHDIPFVEMLNNAMEELQEKIKPQRLNPLFTEANIKEYYADILRPTDTLKPLSYQNKYGAYWVVCDFNDLGLETTDKQRFAKMFEKSNTIHHGASSGFSLKKTFRLMLGHNDLRLHSTLYKNKVNACSLIRLDQVWRHNDDTIDRRTCYIEDLRNNNKSLKK